MRKPGRPSKLIDLIYNVKNQMYEISEKGVTYGMEIEMTRELKHYFSNNSTNNLEDWFKSLSKVERGKIVRTGIKEKTTQDEFFADPEFDQ